MRNPKNDEDLEKIAENFFVSLYQVLEQTKVILKNELRSYFLQERLQLLRRTEPGGGYLGNEYDFKKVPPVAYMRKRALQDNLTRTLMAHLEHSTLNFMRIPRDCYSERLKKSVEAWNFR
jgi:hypothetical protein